MRLWMSGVLFVAMSGCVGPSVVSRPDAPETSIAPAPSPSPDPPDVEPASVESSPVELTSAHARARLSRASTPGTPIGSELASRASSLVGVRSLAEITHAVPDDCSGFVRLVYGSAGVELLQGEARPTDNGVATIYRHARSIGALHRRPHPGDLVFFRETYDRNHDGRRNDGLTHIGIVERVDPDGTVTFVHHGSQGIARSHLNLRAPRLHRDGEGRLWNDILRCRTPRLREYLTGELFSGFASAERLVRSAR